MTRPKIAAPVVLKTLHFRREGEPLDGPAYAVILGSREELHPVVEGLMRTEPRPVPDSFRLFDSTPLGLEVARVPSEYVVTIGGVPVPPPPAPAAAAPRKKRKDAGKSKPRPTAAQSPNGTLPLPEPADVSPPRQRARAAT